MKQFKQRTSELKRNFWKTGTASLCRHEKRPTNISQRMFDTMWKRRKNGHAKSLIKYRTGHKRDIIYVLDISHSAKTRTDKTWNNMKTNKTVAVLSAQLESKFSI
jgi:hypothetical protein